MNQSIPAGARGVARVLVLSGRGRLLLLRAEDATGRRWWIAPGGGLEAGESFEAAARRELHEETGQSLRIGPCVWVRRHIYHWGGRRFDQYERFFVARTGSETVSPVRGDSYVTGHRWWSLSQIASSDATFAPRRLAELLPAILRGEHPDPPIDCGV